MKRLLALILVPLALAACSDSRLTPAPGEAPGWPGIGGPPRPSYAPLPFTDTYLPASPVQTMDAVPAGQTVPYAVPPGTARMVPVAAAPAPVPAPAPARPAPPAAPITAATEAPPPAPAPPIAPVSAEALTPSICHKIPQINFEGKQSSTVCQQANGSWVYIPD